MGTMEIAIGNMSSNCNLVIIILKLTKHVNDFIIIKSIRISYSYDRYRIGAMKDIVACSLR